MFYSLFIKLKNKLKKTLSSSVDCRNKDEIYLNLDGLEIVMNRYFAYDQPHEVSVFVPRAELRKKVEEDGKTEEIEVLLNSITVVHSPQRPSNNQGEEIIKSPVEQKELKNKKQI